MKLTFLGTGTSIGVPEMCCHCQTCLSEDPHDKRLRTSAWIVSDTTSIVIDCGPDFRQQTLRAGIERIDAVLLTHEHYDHVGGLDDLRPYCTDRVIPVYAEQNVIQHVKERMPYCFGSEKKPRTPSMELREIHPGERFTVGDIGVLPLRVWHGPMPIVGFRIGKLTYITDMKSMDDDTFELIRDTGTLVVNALHTKEHPTHQNVRQAVLLAERVGAKETWFIHMSHRAGLHEVMNAKFPPHVRFAHDGLSITLP
ncbi:MAG: MBL fold metallo-hydrolase [Bacteroidaceae bacterium]|nr:MBL fold metallo-hydrolase [Bacteroidaceae bacterium]